jgi:hypothetical protein
MSEEARNIAPLLYRRGGVTRIFSVYFSQRITKPSERQESSFRVKFLHMGHCWSRYSSEFQRLKSGRWASTDGNESLPDSLLEWPYLKTNMTIFSLLLFMPSYAVLSSFSDLFT